MKTRNNNVLKRSLSSKHTRSPYFAQRDDTLILDGDCSLSSPSENWIVTNKLPLHLAGNRYFHKNEITVLRRIQTAEDFSLSQAICSYGYFCLAPNRWVPGRPIEKDNICLENHGDDDKGYLVRPLTYYCTKNTDRSESEPGASPPSKTVLVAIGQDTTMASGNSTRSVLLALPSSVEPIYHHQITTQVDRMLRLHMTLEAFHQVHDEARDRGFGRLYRSPTLFEDMVKTITNCNMKWGGTVEMNAKLCRHVGSEGAFPTPAEIHKVGAEFLKKHCRVGYRCTYIWNLARDVVEGHLDLSRDLNESLDRETLEKRLLQLQGIGPFAANNILQLMGVWDTHPYDTETVRLWKEDFGAPSSTTKTELFQKAKEHYARYHPFSFLSYWFDLWKNYERRARARSPQWSIEQCEAERPPEVESDHNVFFVNSTTKTKGNTGKRKRLKAQPNESQ